MKIIIDFDPATKNSHVGTDVPTHPAVLAVILESVRQAIANGVVQSLDQASDIAIAHAVPKFNGALRIAGNGHGD